MKANFTYSCIVVLTVILSVLWSTIVLDYHSDLASSSDTVTMEKHEKPL